MGRILEHVAEVDDDCFTVAVPAVLGTSWNAPDGRHGTVLVNHTTEAQEAVVTLGHGSETSLTVTYDSGEAVGVAPEKGSFMLSLPPLSSAVVHDG